MFLELSSAHSQTIGNRNNVQRLSEQIHKKECDPYNDSAGEIPGLIITDSSGEIPGVILTD